jgi:hypothetical protein
MFFIYVVLKKKDRKNKSTPPTCTRYKSSALPATVSTDGKRRQMIEGEQEKKIIEGESEQ